MRPTPDTLVFLDANDFIQTEVMTGKAVILSATSQSVEEIMVEKGHIFLEDLMRNPVHGWENDDTEIRVIIVTNAIKCVCFNIINEIHSYLHEDSVNTRTRSLAIRTRFLPAPVSLSGGLPLGLRSVILKLRVRI
ncbi:hypothetical protein Nmel_008483 [Mimus melanotis]